MRQAIAAAIADEMAADERVVLIGEDVAEAEGVFKTSEGLLERFGPDRVRDTPISEMGFVGLAVGVAASGYRPIVEIMFGEFMGVALDQLSTQAAKMRYLSRGEFISPIVVRMSVGPGLGFGAQHSQTLESWFVNTPGLKVVEPSGAKSAYGLLRAAIRDDDPVVFLEPRILYGERENVDFSQHHEYAIGRARTVAHGSDVTVVAAGQTVPIAVAAAGTTAVSAEVIDLGSISPWDADAVAASVERTGRLVIVEANPYSGGWGAAIVAEISSRCFGNLKAPAHRITCPDIPVPYAAPLEARYVPTPESVAEQLEFLVSTGVLPEQWWKKEMR
jgi:pyruvate dehydrogenase E1 component beta subunit